MADTTTWTPISAPTDFQDDAVFNIDFKTKTVQVLVEQPIVAGENLSQFIKFQAPRFYDAIDLTEMMVNILYVSPAGNKGISAAVNTEYSDDMIRCGWLVPYAACPQKGTLHFVLEFVGADYTLKTTIANTPVLDSINDEDVVPEPAEQAWYIALQDNVSVTLQAAQTALGRIESIFNALSTPVAASDASEMQDENTIYVYTGSETGYTYGDWYYYDGTTWVSGGEYASTALLVDDTLSRAGQAADAKAVGDAINNAVGDVTDDIANLKRDIITGLVSIDAGTVEISPSASDFQVARITPKNGNVTANSATFFAIDDVNTTYYPLLSTDFLADNIKSIQGAYSDIYFVLFCYDKTTSEYLGAIYQEYTFKSKVDLEASNRLYPYNSVDMDRLKALYPDYKYKLEIADASVNHEALPVVSDILDWCTYTVPRATSQRQLVKTVNGTAPDSTGNIELEITTDSVPTQDSTNPISSGAVWDLQEELTSADDAEVYSFFDFGHVGYYINTSGQITERAGTDWGYTEDYYPVDASTEYHLKITDTVFVAEYASDKSFIKCASITASTAKFTASATTAYIRISAKSADWDMLMSTADFFGNYRLDMMRDAWTRKIEEEITPVRDTTLYTLLDFGHAGYYINTSGQIVSASAVWGYTETYYPVDSSTEYFLKISDGIFVAEYASDKSFIKCESVSVATAKFTTTATTAYIRISAKNPDWIPLIVSTTAFFGNYDMALINDAIERKTGGIDAGEIDKIKNATVLTLFGFGHQGYYINTSGNVVSTNQTWGYTDAYYPVNPSTEYFLKTTDTVFIAEYASDKSFIKCASITASVAKFTSTANTAYVRIDAKVADWDKFTMSTTPFFGNYDMGYIDSAIDRKTGAITKGNLYGKKIVFFGDSITGNYKPPADYPSFFAQATGATIYNAGFGGTCMCDNGETKGIFSFCRLVDAIVDGDWTAQDNSGFVRNYIDDATEENYVPSKLAMLKAINWAEIDYVMTNHGTNDWGSGYTIDNANNLYDKTTYAGAFRYAFEKLQTAYPNIKIIPITPLTRISHEGSVYYDSNEYDKGTGQYLYQFANKIIDVAENKYFTRPCDLYHSCMITKWNHTRYLRDGIHPTTTGGQEWVAQLLVAFFNSYI